MNKIKEFSEQAISLYSMLNKIDVEEASKLFKDLTHYYSSKKSDRIKYNSLLNLQETWYKSLDDYEPNYSVYSDKYYFIDLMACYWIYSKNYIVNLNKRVFDSKTKTINEKFNNIKSILDLGCGLGYTTNDLIKLFPNSKVYCSNIENTPQWYHCIEVLDDNVTLINENTLINEHIDLIFASEFFEHLKEPLTYLQKIIELNTPNILIIANSFNTKSIGHFYTYDVNGCPVDQAIMSKLFNGRLKNLGYKKEKTSIWNDKPSIWVKNES
jgi:SAM-dependent methyltransferase